MRNGTWDQRTVLQTHDPAAGDRYVPVVTMEGVSLPLDSPLALTIDGDRWHVVRRQTAVDARTRTVVTTVTVVKDNGVTLVFSPATPNEAVSRGGAPYPNYPLAR